MPAFVLGTKDNARNQAMSLPLWVLRYREGQRQLTNQQIHMQCNARWCDGKSSRVKEYNCLVVLCYIRKPGRMGAKQYEGMMHENIWDKRVPRGDTGNEAQLAFQGPGQKALRTEGSERGGCAMRPDFAAFQAMVGIPSEGHWTSGAACVRPGSLAPLLQFFQKVLF